MKNETKIIDAQYEYVRGHLGEEVNKFANYGWWADELKIVLHATGMKAELIDEFRW